MNSPLTATTNVTVISVANFFLRVQFIRGLRDSWLCEQLLESGQTKFDKLLKKATALEASKIESAELEKRSSTSHHGDTIGSDTYCLSGGFRRSRRPSSNSSRLKQGSHGVRLVEIFAMETDHQQGSRINFKAAAQLTFRPWESKGCASGVGKITT